MTEFIQQQEDGRTLCAVLGELNIYSAAQAREVLLGSLIEHETLEIDLAGVSDFDTSGVQILLMLKKEAQRRGRQLTFINHAPAVSDVLDMLNLVGELGDPVVIPLDARGGRR